MSFRAFIFPPHFARIAALLLVMLQPASSVAESLVETYRAAKDAMASGDAAKCVALLEPRVPEAQGEQRRALLFTLGVALIKVGRPADAERILNDVKPAFEGLPEMAEVWALIGDARAAQSNPGGASEAYSHAAREGADKSAIARYAAARNAELAAADLLQKGETLSAVGKLREAAGLSPDRVPAARTLLGEIAADRKLRGESTAASLFVLGEIEERAGHLPEAIAYYQRVFVSWLKYPKWVANSYLRAAECFEKLGRRKEAIAHLHEMMRKADRLRDQKGFEEGKQKLREWAPPSR